MCRTCFTISSTECERLCATTETCNSPCVFATYSTCTIATFPTRRYGSAFFNSSGLKGKTCGWLASSTTTSQAPEMSVENASSLSLYISISTLRSSIFIGSGLEIETASGLALLISTRSEIFSSVVGAGTAAAAVPPAAVSARLDGSCGLRGPDVTRTAASKLGGSWGLRGPAMLYSSAFLEYDLMLTALQVKG